MCVVNWLVDSRIVHPCKGAWDHKNMSMSTSILEGCLLVVIFPIIKISGILRVFMGASSILRIYMTTSVFLVDLVLFKMGAIIVVAYATKSMWNPTEVHCPHGGLLKKTSLKNSLIQDPVSIPYIYMYAHVKNCTKYETTTRHSWGN